MEGLDYAYPPRPTPAQVKTAGKGFVVRYLGGSLDARALSVVEKDALLAAGIAIALVYETQAARALSGYAAGQTDAHGAIAASTALGLTLPVYFAVDVDTRYMSLAQLEAIDAYFKGVSSVIGLSRTGVYGGIHIIERCQSLGTARWFWQTYAWSGTAIAPGAHLYQYNIYAALNGIPVDLDRSLQTDFGQFPRPVCKASLTFKAYSARRKALIAPNATVYGYDPARPGQVVEVFRATSKGSAFWVCGAEAVSWPSPCNPSTIPHGTFVKGDPSTTYGGAFTNLLVVPGQVKSADGKPW